MFSPEQLRAMIEKGVEASLPSAVHDATMEAVKTLVEAQIQTNVLPGLLRDLVKGGAFPVSALAPTSPTDELVKAGRIRGQLDQQPKGLTSDPFTALDQMGFRERPTLLGYHTLQEMSRKCPPVTAVIQTRVNQMGSLSVPQPDPYSLGFQITLADKNAEMTPQLKRRAQEISDWIVKCGNPKVKAKRPKFMAFTKAVMWDALSLDQVCAEIIPDRRDTPSWWRPLDGSTLRVADDLDEVNDDPDSIQYVQVYDENIIAEFRESELLFGIRNPRTDIRYSMYGTSELEMLIVIVTALLNAIEYNAAFFSSGTVAKGIINFKGAIPDRELEAFRRQWNAMVTGIMNAWRTPVVNSEGVEWINMNQTPRDLEFSQFMDWLLKIVCGIYLIAPEEIGFQFGNQGQSSTMNEGGIQEKLEFSKDKGLVPLATSYAEWLNDKIVTPLDDRFSFGFTGINARTREQAIELHTKETSSVRTVDEVRKERGDPPLPDGKGAIILNQIWLESAQAIDGVKAQGQQGGGPQLDDGNVSQDPAQQGDDGQQGGAADQGQQNQPGAPDLEQESGAEGDDMAASEDGRRRSGLSARQKRAMQLVKALTFDVEL